MKNHNYPKLFYLIKPHLKFTHSKKATKFCEISTVDLSMDVSTLYRDVHDLSYVVAVKSTVEISQNFVTFSEYMNFNTMIQTHTADMILQ